MSIGSVVRKILSEKKRYAIVALPCQIYGLRQIAKKIRRLEESLVLLVGMVCGYTYPHNCIDELANQLNCEVSEIKKINGWRENGLPGSFSVRTQKGMNLSIPFSYEHAIDVVLYSQRRCNLCMDCFASYADIAVGDTGEWKEKSSLVIAHTKQGQDVFDRFKDSFIISRISSVNEFSRNNAAFMEREKIQKTFYRIKKERTKGNEVPEWPVEGIEVLICDKVSQEIFEFIQRKLLRKIKKGNISSKEKLRLCKKAYEKSSQYIIVKILYKIEKFFRGIGNHVIK